MWDLPGPGLEPVFPALAGGFFTTVPPGKPCKPLLTRLIRHSTVCICCTNLFVRFSYVFTFLKIIKHDMPKILPFFLPSSTLRWLHKNSPIFISLFLNACWYDSCHIQSNKTVSNEVKDNQALLETAYRKKRRNFFATSTVCSSWLRMPPTAVGWLCCCTVYHNSLKYRRLGHLQGFPEFVLINDTARNIPVASPGVLEPGFL